MTAMDRLLCITAFASSGRCITGIGPFGFSTHRAKASDRANDSSAPCAMSAGAPSSFSANSSNGAAALRPGA